MHLKRDEPETKFGIDLASGESETVAMTKTADGFVVIPPNTFGDGTVAPPLMTNRHARRAQAAQARQQKPSHHNTLQDKATHLLKGG